MTILEQWLIFVGICAALGALGLFARDRAGEPAPKEDHLNANTTVSGGRRSDPHLDEENRQAAFAGISRCVS